jgi:hypothetical protein
MRQVRMQCPKLMLELIDPVQAIHEQGRGEQVEVEYSTTVVAPLH